MEILAGKDKKAYIIPVAPTWRRSPCEPKADTSITDQKDAHLSLSPSNRRVRDLAHQILPAMNKHVSWNHRNAEHDRVLSGSISHKDSPTLEDIEPLEEQRAVPRLAHNLDRVLFNPSVYWLQDPNSGVYNFPKILESLPQVTNFAFERLPQYITSSRDKEMYALARREGRQFIGSTSSLSGVLCHIYYLLSGHKDVDISTLSMAFSDEPRGFPGGIRLPATLGFRRSPDGIYAIDAIGDPDDEGKNVLSFVGTMLESFLTLPAEEFQSLLRDHDALVESAMTQKSAYRYARSRKFVMRSQLDCQDDRLPGTGVFDIKTRATLPIRKDRLNWVENTGYQIKRQTGLFESFEREYYDLIRSAFLKFQFQVRIGNMDGIFVAYHNTLKLFGFQYVPLHEMDERLFGSHELGDQVFSKCLAILEVLAEEIVGCFPNEPVQAVCETREGSNTLNIWVQPVSPDVVLADAPIAQITLQISHTLDDLPATFVDVLKATNPKWESVYSLARSVSPQEDLKRDLLDVKSRSQMALFLPDGVSAAEMEKRWRTLNYGASASDTDDIVDAKNHETTESTPESASRKFRRPHQHIRHLRELARSHRVDSASDPEVTIIDNAAPPDTSSPAVPATAAEAVPTANSGDEVKPT
ncbi:Pet127-domain-containing protein [Sistotremastrum niveocremeum HHB9708]|uniref:Pet127-domain-containing protein n=1 Tax=Sistotremastrum niveocremeum HHB9708 TaxID=1314777 RepID=A0A164UVT4_9AGAM|nr:Pet127-domain-containing protein [Sistotremastrum niveocremeum HHB9708]